MQRIIFASANNGKVQEVRYIMSDLNLQILSLSDIDFTGNIEEAGSTFEENARIKAEKIFKRYMLPTIADDSGLVVDQLNGEPGIYSARYSGQNATDAKNNQKLIEKLKKFNKPHNAKFVCAAVFYNGKNFNTALGDVKGEIIYEERGANGFGYDPIFIPNGFKETMAELEPAIKNKISHRYNAFSKLKNILSEKSE